MYTLIKFNSELTAIKRQSDNANIPLDGANRDYQAYLEWCAVGNVAEEDLPPPPSTEQVRANLSSEVQSMLDSKVQERNYDNMVSACSYLCSTNSQFAAEAQACVAWRDAVWAKCYELLDKVTAGEIPLLTEAELLAALPKLQWPEIVEAVADIQESVSDTPVIEEGETVQAEQNG